MPNGGSKKPTDTAPEEEAKIVLKVPEAVDLPDGLKVLIRRLKLREIFLHAPTFLKALGNLTGSAKKDGEGEVEADRSAQGYAFLGAMMVATWEPMVEMLVLATKIQNKDGEEVPTTVKFYEDLDAEPMLNIVRVFVRLHKRVASTFFGVLEEAGFPVQALKAWVTSLKTLMTSLGEGTDSKK